jgi:hypothetical protein
MKSCQNRALISVVFMPERWPPERWPARWRLRPGACTRLAATPQTAYYTSLVYRQVARCFPSKIPASPRDVGRTVLARNTGGARVVAAGRNASVRVTYRGFVTGMTWAPARACAVRANFGGAATATRTHDCRVHRPSPSYRCGSATHGSMPTPIYTYVDISWGAVPVGERLTMAWGCTKATERPAFQTRLHVVVRIYIETVKSRLRNAQTNARPVACPKEEDVRRDY